MVHPFPTGENVRRFLMNMGQDQRQLSEKRQERQEKFNALLKDAGAAFQATDYEGGAKLLGEALQMDPDNVRLLLSQGQMLIMAGRQEQAVEILKKAASRDRANATLQKDV